MISIVIACYNAAATVEKCITTIVNQTYRDIEIIVIDDGSTDGSSEIVMSLCKKDKRIQYYRKENGGVSSARNYGINVCKGEYICFIDSDDYIIENYLELLMNKKQETHADLVLCGVRETDGNSVRDLVLSETEEKRLKGRRETDLYLLRYIMNSPYVKLFSRDVIEKNSLRFREDMVTAEDQYFSYQYSEFCKTIVFVNIPAYIYVKYPTGLSKQITRKCFNNELEILAYKKRYVEQYRVLNGDLLLAEYVCYVLKKYFYLSDDKNDYFAVRKRMIQVNMVNKNVRLRSPKNNLLYQLLRHRLYFLAYCILFVYKKSGKMPLSL